MGETNHITSALDMAYQLLKEGKQELYFRDMLKTVLSAQGIPAHSMTQAMAELHTQVNMDSRFAYRGQGKWGLTEWIPPQRTVRVSEEKSSALPDEEVQIRRAKLQEVQQPEDTIVSYADENDDPS